MERKPIKRSKELTPLSRDHHDSLLLCWKIRTGVKKGIENERIGLYASHFYEKHLKAHFTEEENAVFNVLPAKDVMRQQAEQQHDKLNDLFGELADGKYEPARLLDIAQQLDDHIRYEERELFPYIENRLSTTELTQMGLELNRIHQQDPYSTWEDEFWINKV